jgi:hypothetical protein
MELMPNVFYIYNILQYFEKYPLRAELFLADGQTNWQTDMTKLVVAFRNSANALKKQSCTVFQHLQLLTL